MLRTDTRLPLWGRVLLGLLPFVVVVCLYLWGAQHLRYLEAQGGDEATASSKLMPLPSELWDGFKRSAFEPDRKGHIRLLEDTKASMTRFTFGMAIVSFGIVIGLHMGTFPTVRALLSPMSIFVNMTPPLLLLPILFIVFDTGELAKIALIVIGVIPGVILDARQRALEIPREQFRKAQTLGASEFEIAWSIVFPQILPKMLGTLRFNFKAGWMLVFAGEAISASAGIGYRVYLSQRYVAMDVIIPYVLWATVLMFALDAIFQWLEGRFRWTNSQD